MIDVEVLCRGCWSSLGAKAGKHDRTEEHEPKKRAIHWAIGNGSRCAVDSKNCPANCPRGGKADNINTWLERDGRWPCVASANSQMPL